MTTTELSNVDIVVYAIFKLGGVEKKIHTEHIAMESFKLSKQRFCWRLPKYKKFPDKDLVRVTLSNARKKQCGQLIAGRSGVEASGKEADGWMLTPEGTKWIIKNSKRIEQALKIETTAVKRPDIYRILRKFEKEKCYQKFLKYGNLKNINEYDFKDMLSCSPDAYPENIKREFNRLKIQAELTQNKNILVFLKACEKTFEYLMSIKTK